MVAILALLKFKFRAACANFSETENSDSDIYLAKTPRAPSDGQCPSSRVDTRDLRKISPFGRNDISFPLRALRLCERYSEIWLRLCRAGLIVAVLAPQLADACAVCITGANDPAADAYNWSVVFLLTAPYLVFGSIAGSLFLIYRRKVARRNREESADLSLQIAWNQKENG
jgi:hypothetical protein